MPGTRLSASCQGAMWTCAEPYDDGACGGVGYTDSQLLPPPGPVPLSADDRELAELLINLDKSP